MPQVSKFNTEMASVKYCNRQRGAVKEGRIAYHYNMSVGNDGMLLSLFIIVTKCVLKRDR